MKKNLITLGIVFAVVANVFGWGATGHRATGLIAEQYMNAKAKKRVAAILDQESIAMVTPWMDEIRSDSTYNYCMDWHWSTIPDGKKYEDVEAIANPDGKLIPMIEKIVKELKSGKLPAKQEKDYLRMLVHMIGDLHQPLHVGKPGDKGGNDVKVKWFREDTNIHTVWDSEMINHTRLSYTELANGIVKPDNAVVAKWQATTVRDWAMESVGYRSQVYDVGNGNLGYSYQYKNFGIVKMRILQAGIRLGGLLNEIYGK